MTSLAPPESVEPADPFPSHSRLWLWAPVALNMLAIFIASSLSTLPPAPGLTDKGEHFAAYGLLSALTLRALAHARLAAVSLTIAVYAALLAIAYGVFDEWHQHFVPMRSPDVIDVAADVFGAATAAMAIWAWSIIRKNRT